MKKFTIKILAMCLVLATMFTLVACGGSAVTPDSIKKSGKLVISTNAAFPPFEYIEEGGAFAGVDIDIAKELAEALGVQLEVKDMAFTGVVGAVQSKVADMALAGLTVNEKRKKSIDFSTSYYDASQMMLVKIDNTTFDGMTTVEQVEAAIAKLGTADNKGKIGVQDGTTAKFYVEGDEEWGFNGFASTVDCAAYPNGALAVADLINGTLNAVIIDEMPAKSFLKANADKVKLVNVKLTEEEYAIGIPKNCPELKKFVDDKIASMKADGTMETIMSKYFG